MEFTSFGEVLSRGELFLSNPRATSPGRRQRPLKTESGERQTRTIYVRHLFNQWKQHVIQDRSIVWFVFQVTDLRLQQWISNACTRGCLVMNRLSGECLLLEVVLNRFYRNPSKGTDIHQPFSIEFPIINKWLGREISNANKWRLGANKMNLQRAREREKRGGTRRNLTFSNWNTSFFSFYFFSIKERFLWEWGEETKEDGEDACAGCYIPWKLQEMSTQLLGYLSSRGRLVILDF